MNKFINISLLLGFIIFTGCLERPHGQMVIYSPSLPLPNSNTIVNEASKHLGKPYKYGATGPDKFDCSGFVYAVHRDLGVKIPRTSLNQSQIEGRKLSRKEIKIGDLLFFDTSLKGHVNHSGIYLGNDKFIHASSGKAFSVTISRLNGWYKDKFRWGKYIKKP